MDWCRPEGDASASLDFQFPLENKLQIDDVQIHATARLTRVRVPALVAGQDLGDGAFDLSVDKDGLSFRGRAALARMPVALDGMMDFTQGVPDQIVQRISVTGRPDAAQLDAAGIAVAGLVSGPIQASAVLVERRSGDGFGVDRWRLDPGAGGIRHPGLDQAGGCDRERHCDVADVA